MPHIHTFTEAEAGIDVCTDCPTTQHNPATADQGVTLAECSCGRGMARFGPIPDGPFVCATCFGENVAADRGRAVA